MALIADILLAAGALAAGLYCAVLSHRLRRFARLEDGMGGAIAVLSAQVDDMTRALRAAQKAAQGSEAALTVAVLLNEPRTQQPDGTFVPAPRPEDEIAALRDLVASAVGFDESRGDVITLRTMPFAPVTEPGTLVEQGRGSPVDVMALSQIGVLAAVALALGLFVLRPILLARPEPDLPAPDTALALPGASGAVTSAEDAPDGAFSLPALGNRGDTTPEDPVARLRRLIDARRDETVEILRNWMEDPENREERS